MKESCEQVAEELRGLYVERNAPVIKVVAALELLRGSKAGLPGDVVELAEETTRIFEKKGVSEVERVWIIDLMLYQLFYLLLETKKQEALNKKKIDDKAREQERLFTRNAERLKREGGLQ